MRLVGLGRELVDGRRVDGVLPLLRALDVPVFAAPRTKEMAFQSLAVRTASAAAFCGLRGASSAATGRSTIQTFLTGARPLLVGLDRAWPLAAPLATSWWFRGKNGGRDEARPARCRGAGGCGLPGCRPTRRGGLRVVSSTLVRSWRSRRPEGGSGSDRYPSGTRLRERAWSPQAIEHGPPPAAPPIIVCQRRRGSFVGTLQPSASHQRTPPRLRTTRQEERSPLGRERAGCEEVEASPRRPRVM